MLRRIASSWRVAPLLAVWLTQTVTAHEAAAADEPALGQARAQTEALVRTYRACCGGAGTAPSASCAAVDLFFDYPALAKRTLAPMQKVLTPRQRRRLEAAVTQIFARTAQGSGRAFCGDLPAITGAKATPAGIEASLEVTEQGEDVPSTFAFVWQQREGRWLVQDLLVEGGSLITDYQNQFARIRQKEGTTGLLARIEARLARAGKQGASVHDKDKI